MKSAVKNKEGLLEAKGISGAEAVIRCLLAEGVDLVFGYPGGAIMPIYDELFKFQDQLHHVLTRHEQGATHMAQGFARTSGKVGVAMATSGPGATNLVTGIADAQIDSTPMVCIPDRWPHIFWAPMLFKKRTLSGFRHPSRNGITKSPKRVKSPPYWPKPFI